MSAVVNRLRLNEQNDPSSSPYIYSIRVVEPSNFRMNPELIESLQVANTPINVGSFYANDIYRLDRSRVRLVLKGMITSGARIIEVKVAESPGGPWDIIRVRLPG